VHLTILNKKIGNISYYDSSGQNEYSFSKPFSEETARTIDEEIHNLVEESYAKAKVLLTENREKLNQLAEILLQKEVIFREDLEKIFGKRPFDDHDHLMMNGIGETKEQQLLDAAAEAAVPVIESTEEDVQSKENPGIPS
jgi:hypothetical protein